MDILLAILAVVVGWFLNEISQWRRHEKERKRAVAMILMDLFLFRQRILAARKPLEQISRHFPLSVDQRSAFKELIESMIPKCENGTTRYDEALCIISGSNPDLALKIRT
jgi:hypothetical protein